MEYIESVAEEQCDGVCFGENPESTSNAKDRVSLPQASNTLMEAVCQSLSKDTNLPEDFRENFANIDISALVEKLQFLDSCLVPQGKMKNAAKEKSWARFYTHYIEQIDNVTSITGSPEASAWICLRAFERMLSIESNSKEQKGGQKSVPIQAEEKGTIKYIGGCVVRKIKERVWRLPKTTYTERKMQCLEDMCQERESTEGDMTSLLDRGGLTYIKPEMVEMFYRMEELFREKAGSGEVVKQCNSADFVQAGSNHRHIGDAFCGAMCMHDTQIISDVLDNCLVLFFKIRIHHRLKIIMDRRRIQENKSRKEKGLRKTIKAASTS